MSLSAHLALLSVISIFILAYTTLQFGCEGATSGDPAEKLLEAVRGGDLGSIKEAVESGADPNKISNRSTTPLLEAIEHEELPSYRLLLDLGADPNLLIDDLPASDRLNSAMRRAIGAENLSYLTFALEHGGDPNLTTSKSGNTRLLTTAINYGDYEAFALLYEKGADISHVTTYGRSLLEYAIVAEAYDIASFLLQRGADPTIKNQGGTSPLDFFIEYPITNKEHFRYKGYKSLEKQLRELGYIED